MKGLKIYFVLMMIGLSGCATNLINPLCLPSRPLLQPITVEEQIEIPPDTLGKVADNQEVLKSHIRTIERITEAHNEQFKAGCSDDDNSS